MEPTFKLHAKIQKPVAEVFDAVYNPKKLSGYFTTGGANAPLDEGTTVMWAFAEPKVEPFPVKVKKVVKNELIEFWWESTEGGYDTKVEMRFEPIDRNSTLVSISESGWKDTEKGVKSSYQNCEGWSQMAACLKAFVEHGINLRKGYY